MTDPISPIPATNIVNVTIINNLYTSLLTHKNSIIGNWHILEGEKYRSINSIYEYKPYLGSGKTQCFYLFKSSTPLTPPGEARIDYLIEWRPGNRDADETIGIHILPQDKSNIKYAINVYIGKLYGRDYNVQIFCKKSSDISCDGGEWQSCNFFLYNSAINCLSIYLFEPGQSLQNCPNGISNSYSKALLLGGLLQPYCTLNGVSISESNLDSFNLRQSGAYNLPALLFGNDDNHTVSICTVSFQMENKDNVLSKLGLDFLRAESCLNAEVTDYFGSEYSNFRLLPDTNLKIKVISFPTIQGVATPSSTTAFECLSYPDLATAKSMTYPDLIVHLPGLYSLVGTLFRFSALQAYPDGITHYIIKSIGGLYPKSVAFSIDMNNNKIFYTEKLSVAPLELGKVYNRDFNNLCIKDQGVDFKIEIRDLKALSSLEYFILKISELNNYFPGSFNISTNIIPDLDDVSSNPRPAYYNNDVSNSVVLSNSLRALIWREVDVLSPRFSTIKIKFYDSDDKPIEDSEKILGVFFST